MMKRISAVLGLTILTMAAGCETLGKPRRETLPAGLPGHFEPESPMAGAKGLTESARPPGAWSRDAADIERSLNNRSANPSW